jgi:hypothetical protein
MVPSWNASSICNWQPLKQRSKQSQQNNRNDSVYFHHGFGLTFTVTLTFWPGFNPVTVAFAEIIDAIFGCAAPAFVRNKPKDIFTSLLE